MHTACAGLQPITSTIISSKCIFFLKKKKVVVVAENTYAIVQEKNENVLFEYTFGKEGGKGGGDT